MAFNSPIDFVLVRFDQLLEVHPPSHVIVACLVTDPEILAKVPDRSDVIVVCQPGHLDAARKTSRLVGYRTTIDSSESLEQCKRIVPHVDYLLLRFLEETNIPLELLIAEKQSSTTRTTSIVKEVVDVTDALAAFGVLEEGSEGVIFPAPSCEEIVELKNRLIAQTYNRLKLAEATVTRGIHVGMGYRGCVDTASLLGADEGMLVGSTSHGGILVCAEVHPLPYMNTRPFRVNAGAVHSYVWAPNDVTEYITDLRAGGKVLAVSTRGVARPVIVGRIKVEVRPLRLIEASAGDAMLTLILQDDWHVRVFGADGQPLNCTAVKSGTKLLAHVCEPGRHVGIKVSESIVEW